MFIAVSLASKLRFGAESMDYSCGFNSLIYHPVCSVTRSGMAFWQVHDRVAFALDL